MSDGIGLWEILVATFWFMLLMSWIWLIIAILGDIFRDRELGGGGKAMWTLLIVFLPWIGALSYLIARGASMNERTARAAQDNEARMRAYVGDAARSTSTADELRKLGELRDRGAITTEDFEKAKAKALA